MSAGKKSALRKKNGLRHTVRGRFTLIFLLIMTGTVLMTVLFSNIYIEKYYLNQKEALFEDLYYDIKDIFSAESSISIDRSNYLKRLCDNYGIDILLSNSGMSIVFSNGDSDEMQYLLRDCIFADGDIIPFPGTNAYIIDKIDNNDNYSVFKIHDNNLNADYLLCFGHFDIGVYFVFKAPIQNITENAMLASRFYAFVAIVATICGSIIAYFVIKKLTQPIMDISDIAERTAHMDFSAKYTGKDANEIGVLGNSINYMSEQLERTIIELKTANLELQRDIEKKEQIDEMRKEFLSNVSHELKTPIALIQGYAEGLKEGINDDPESNEWYCDVIIDEAAKMNNMVKKLLNLNQLEFGNNQISMEHFDLSTLLEGVLNNFHYMFEQKGVKLIVDKPDTLMVWADEFMIEEVISNYISNALNHAAGDKVITVEAQKLNGRAVVSVKNTGLQIPEDSLSKVWIKFYKVDKARTREYGGSGIGLSIVKAIMDSHNKPYGVYNNDDGVTFWFELDSDAE